MNCFSAIDLTSRHPQYLEIVVGFRQKYLKEYGGGKKETNPKYQQAMKNVRYALNYLFVCFFHASLLF